MSSQGGKCGWGKSEGNFSPYSPLAKCVKYNALKMKGEEIGIFLLKLLSHARMEDFFKYLNKNSPFNVYVLEN